MNYVLLPPLETPDAQGRLSAHAYAALDLLRLFYGPGRASEAELVVCAHAQASEGDAMIWAELDEQRACCVLLSASDASDLRPVVEALFGDDSKAAIPPYLEAIRARSYDWASQVEIAERAGRSKVFFALPILAGDSSKMRARKLKRCLYQALCQLSGRRFPWGSLTGIRPTYVAGELLDAGLTARESALRLSRDYAVQSTKAELAVRVAQAEQSLLRKQAESKVLLYIGIAFCPSRCSYCSFSTSEGIAPTTARVERYLTALIQEMQALSAAGLFEGVDCLYVGGGTPGILSGAQMQRLLHALGQSLPLSQLSEFSFEAGRCDCVDLEKLRILKDGGVSRLCLNPQTMRADTLRRVNRPADPESLRLRYAEARRCAFQSISMDLIAGLGEEQAEDFAESLREVIALGPDSLTLHSLALKRASSYAELLRSKPLAAELVAELAADENAQTRRAALCLGERLQRPDLALQRMLEEGEKLLGAAGYAPYYLYRQKDGIGGLENVGYARPGHACVYNVCMMADRHSVVALGAGGMSKKVRGERVERCPSPRSIAVYEERIAALIERKIAFFTS